MNYKRFEPKDLVYNTIVAKPEYSIIVNSGVSYLQKETSESGSFGNKIKHINSGEISLYELNINRPSGSLIHSFIQKDSTRYANKTISTSNFDDIAQFAYGQTITQSYPLTASVNRIYIPQGQEHSSSLGPAHANKKYITSLENVIKTQGKFSYGLKYGSLGTDEINMICIPGIYYGSSIEKGSIRLRYSITGSLLAEAKDIHKNGKLIQTQGPTTGSVIGNVLYNQGIILLTDTTQLDSSYDDKYKHPTIRSNPSWVTFGTGLPQVGQVLEHGNVTGSVFSINFRGTNKIPTLTMYAYAKESEYNFSTNPTFVEKSTASRYNHSSSYFLEAGRKIKKINKSPYYDHEEDFENTTYISKVGIYDQDKNLIAIATLAKPVRKTEKREYMFKIGIDF